ncbi:DUF2255 family protein [Isoptericola sp. NPDC057391]|uniref:DUF2255 family protein n=1 Tax=Isoptericola sp. NPDC057391 TaxID=3346117 RepID=UPI00364141B0
MTLLTRATAFLHELDVLEALEAATAVQVVMAREPRPWRGWMVRLGHDLYVRSAPEVARRAGGGRAHLQVDGTRQPVVLAEVAPELHALLDDAYLARYGRCAPEKVAAVTSDVAAASTFRVRLRRATWGERVAEALDAARLARRPRRVQEPCPSC